MKTNSIGLFNERILTILFTIITIIGPVSCNTESIRQHEAEKKKLNIMYRSISGSVVNARDMKPIRGVLVTFFNPMTNKPVGTLTDSEGKFRIDSIPEAVRKITSIDIQSNKSKEVELNKGDTVLIKMD
ncbi:MAG TPA: carboxypeptidase-like regulatory domain-containing protein [Bacteroidales bacterium]|nr:carboxypeptidase-like regulatory domain-containing protein [Bacteroidales bacterium]